MIPQQPFVIGNDGTKSEQSMESRSFLRRVNGQVRKRQKRHSMNVAENEEKTFHGLENVHGCDNGISNIHGIELPEQLSVHSKHNRSHSKMFDIYKNGV